MTQREMKFSSLIDREKAALFNWMMKRVEKLESENVRLRETLELVQSHKYDSQIPMCQLIAKKADEM